MKKIRGFFCAATLVSFLSFAPPGSPQINSGNRILHRVDAADTALVRRTAHPLARPEHDVGRVSPVQPLGGVTLTFRLSPAQQSDLNRLLREQQDPKSPNYHKWLTPDQYANRFGMTATDLAKVTAWLQSQGLRVESISRSRTEISFSGSVGQIEYALKTELHNYSVHGEMHFANATDVSLPAAFSADVLGVRGLNDFHPRARIKASPRFTSNLSGNHFLIPGDFATIYHIPANLDGTGQSIAVVGQTVISTTDLDAFRSAAGLPATTSTNFQQIVVTGTTPALTCTGDETEADLDLEWSEAVAKKANIKYVYAGVGSANGTCTNRTKNVFDALQFAIVNNIAPVISISYGNCEANLSQSFVLTMQQWAQQANAQGQTISGPAGDEGATDCELPTATSAVKGLAVDAPASIPEVTGVGATEFTGDSDACPGATCTGSVAPQNLPYWNGSSTLNSPASALMHIPETTWNNPTSSGLASGGGGASKLFAKPSWQTGAGVPNDGKRDVPDIALSGSNAHDPYLICSQDFFASATPPVNLTSCSNTSTTGFRASDGKTLEGIGGTSAGAPTFAGVVALINQGTGSNGLGNVNPMLYQLAINNPSAFNDVNTSGTNKQPCTSGTPDCPAGTISIGFTAGPGYDQVTGLGSLDVGNLVAAWSAATADFSMEGLVANVSVPGAQGTSTITVTPENGFSGTVNLACAPSSSTAKITCALSPTSVTLTGSGVQTSTLTISTVARLEEQQHRGLWFATGGTLFAAVICLGIPSRPRRLPALFCLLMLAWLAVLPSCGGGSSSVGSGSNGTPAGTYLITVTGTSGAISHSTVVSLTVQ